MKMFRAFLFGSGKGIKDWALSLQRYFLEDEYQTPATYEFRDPYHDLHYMHDMEMERLVKTIEDMKSDSRPHYQ